jgi:putative molybdopterin biosynthesis protein
VPLAAALSRVLAADVVAAVDAPPFDRSNVDGFAVRAADTVGASDAASRRLALNAEVVTCGIAPAVEVGAGTATAIATGGVIPRGADAVVVIEHTDLVEDGGAPAIDVRRAAASGHSFLMRARTSRAARPCCTRAHTSVRVRSACWRRAGLPRLKWCGARASACFRPATN